MTELRPLGDRVLIAPDVAPTMTASGLHLSEHWKPEQTGTVVALGPSHPHRAEIEALIAHLETAHPNDGSCPCTLCKAASWLRDLLGVAPEMTIGDRVVFSWQVGQELWVNDHEARYLLMRQSDLLAVVEGDAV